MSVVAAVFAALYAAHMVADHWGQTQYQADHKGLPGWLGRWNCAKHVITYTLTGLVALAGLAAATGWRPAPGPLTAGLAISAITHYIADRRTPLRRMATAIGKSQDWVDHGGGLYVLDQSWHIGWLFVASLVIAA